MDENKKVWTKKKAMRDGTVENSHVNNSFIEIYTANF